MLPSDLISIAFQSRNDKKVNSVGAAGTTFAYGALQDVNHIEGSSKGSGKKGKKGKKVSPSICGFNVDSNRIMMGEIQSVEDEDINAGKTCK